MTRTLLLTLVCFFGSVPSFAQEKGEEDFPQRSYLSGIDDKHHHLYWDLFGLEYDYEKILSQYLTWYNSAGLLTPIPISEVQPFPVLDLASDLRYYFYKIRKKPPTDLPSCMRG